MDTFAMPVPQFNIKGETNIKTLCGGITSFIIFMAALAYAVSNSVELVNPQSPQINKVKTTKYFGNGIEEALNLKEVNFKFAFTFRDYLTGETLNNSSYVQW